MKKYLVIRGKPTAWTDLSYGDLWKNYPTKERPFLNRYFKLWDQQYQVSFLEGRQRLRELSLSCFEQLPVTDIVFQELREWQKKKGSEFDGIVLSSDDDDFLAPWLPEEAEKIINGKHNTFFWHDYCSGNMSYTLFACGKLQREVHPHTNNLLFDRRTTTPQTEHKPQRYKGADNIERMLSFYNSNPWSITVVRRLIVTTKKDFWAHYTLAEKLIYFFHSYIRKSEEAFETLSDDVWFKSYWQKVVELAKETLGELVNYQFPQRE